jgi:hypothetical protein
MNILFVTGCNSPFFNSLLVGLQSFAERLPGHRLLVCDFGLTSAQANFLRGLDLWLAQPPNLGRSGVFDCKAALISYLRKGDLWTRFGSLLRNAAGLRRASVPKTSRRSTLRHPPPDIY